MDFKFKLLNQVETKEKENTNMGNELQMLKAELENIKKLNQEEADSLLSKHKIEQQSLISSLESVRKEKEMLVKELDVLKTENLELKSCISTQASSSLMVESQLKATQLQLEVTESQKQTLYGQLTQVQQTLKDTKTEMELLESKLQQEETIRRQLHNTIQELKGNIRVFCRIRPLLENEKEEGESYQHLTFCSEDEASIILNQSVESASGTVVSKDYPFSFDKVSIVFFYKS
jgi:kinesin family protein C1